MNYGIHTNDTSNIIQTIEDAHKLKCNSLQIFVGDRIKTTLKYKENYSNEKIKTIKELLKKYDIKLFIHGLLSLNFCNNPKSERYKWGLTNLIHDMHMADKLGAQGITIHAGRYNTKRYSISPKQCYKHYIQSLIYVLKETKNINIPVLVETPATKKNTIINTIEEFADFYNRIPEKYKKRVKICIDTCHIFVSNYNISQKQGVKDYFKKFNKLIGIKNIKLIHLNDSYAELNSHLNRHAPIGQGFIFKKYKEGLQELIKIATKYKIPMVLETNSKTFHKNISIIKLSQNGGNKIKKTKINKETEKSQKLQISQKNKKELIIQIFEDLLNYYKTLNNSKNKIFRIQSYEKIIKQLKKIPKITSVNNLTKVEGLGQKSKNKIEEILQTNKLKQHNNIKKNLNKIKVLKNFQNIYGIGNVQSKKLIVQGVKNINNLKKKVKSSKIILPNYQKLYLQHINNLKQKIPKNEITKITKTLKSDLKKNKINVSLLNAGSYAMKKEYSSDIDIILLFKKEKYNYETIKEKYKEILIKNKYFVGQLLNGNEKDIYLFKLNKQSKVMQMDVAYVEEKHKYFYILYFSSSRDFSKKIRLIASKKGYKLNEKGLYNKSGKLIDFQPKSEKDIFDFLEIPYIKPENRF